MGMVVRTNMAAINANNSLAQAAKAQQSGMQKLASGFKINKAADDASGLAISEKMKAQIKALDTAKDNCEDGANLIQTTEGYMSETHEMLNRMVELSEKAANGVLEDTDRDALQAEMDELCGEIDRIATTANFNGRKLLDGSIGSNGTVKITSDKNGARYSVEDSTVGAGVTYTVATAPSISVGLSSADHNMLSAKVTQAAISTAQTKSTSSLTSIAAGLKDLEAAQEKFDKAADKVAGDPSAANGSALKTAADDLAAKETAYKGKTDNITVTAYVNKNGDIYTTLDAANDDRAKSLDKNAYSATNTDGYQKIDVTVKADGTINAAAKTNEGIKLQIGESSTAADKMEVSVGSFHTDTLLGGIDGFKNNTASSTGETDSAAVASTKSNETATYDKGISIDISDQNKASAAADALRQVSNYVSDQRGKLGAQQNRLDHTVNNLTTASENVSAANSRIRDTDMAKEMMAYTSKNVIAQAAQSMLAQANLQPQNVLSLLQ